MAFKQAQSLFATKTFKLGLLSLLSGVAPILIKCSYEQRKLSVDDAIAVAALFSAFATALIGRTETSPVYTPNYLPGPNASEFTNTRDRSS